MSPSLTLLLMAMTCWWTPVTRGLSCRPCRVSSCDPVSCGGRDVVKDACGCCDVCSRAEGETCGGYFELMGRCDRGLECRTNLRLGKMTSESARGVCVRARCSTQHCMIMLGKCVCTELTECRDLSEDNDPTSFSSRDVCEEAVRHGAPLPRLRTAAFSADQFASCPGVECPAAVTSCPDDSVLKRDSPDPRCCPPQPICLCDLESCPRKPDCPQDTEVELISEALRQPGRCCDQWQCKKPAGCSSRSGVVRVEGDRWMEDDCTMCRCHHGELQCHTESCPVSCHNARRIPGQCCAVCDECAIPCSHGYKTDQTGIRTCECMPVTNLSRTTPFQCPDLQDCTKQCLHGLAEDELGCTSCECKKCPPLENCELTCKLGYQKDEEGCTLCSCKKSSPTQPIPTRSSTVPSATTASTTSQTTTASTTLQTTKASTTTPTTTTSTISQNTTISITPRITTTSVTSQSTTASTEPQNTYDIVRSAVITEQRWNTANSCLLEDGSTRNAGESWHDGCRQCYCHAGREMCAVIACPAASCAHPNILPGTCCPTCPANSSDFGHMNVSICQSVDGNTYVDGETWTLDTCTSCMCHVGHVLCTAHPCPPTPCRNPIQQSDSCCPSCRLRVAAKTTRRPCSEGGVTRVSGATWHEGACRSCVCHDGEKSCFHSRCPPAQCSRPVLRKHSCCPLCLTPPAQTGCTYKNRTMKEGEVWNIDECTSCTCEDNSISCAKKVCSVTCQSPVKAIGQCCPTCEKDSPRRRVSHHPLNITSRVTHRTRVSVSDPPSQAAPPGIDTDDFLLSVHQIVLYSALVTIVILLALLIWCHCIRRHQRAFYPASNHFVEEKRPLNGNQSIGFSHRPDSQDKLLSREKSISVISNT